MTLGDFVNGQFPLPWTPVISMGEFVAGGFPLPQTPVFFPSANGSLPKAPDIPRAAIAHGSAGPASPTPNMLAGISSIGRSDMIRGFSGMGDRSDMIRGFSGCGCGSPNDMVRGFSGMGTLTSDTLIPQASLPTFLQGDAYITGFPTVYLAGIVVLVAVSVIGGKKGRR